MQIDERAAFEMAYATEWHNSRSGDETVEQLAAEIKGWREGNTYGDDLPRLKFGWEGYQWALSSASTAEPEVRKALADLVGQIDAGRSTDYSALQQSICVRNARTALSTNPARSDAKEPTE